MSVLTTDRARSGDWISTVSGRPFWPLDPRPDEIHIADIAHALSNLCRFNGHCKEFYSVAQHSVLVSCECEPSDALWGLLHDAPEAYLTDLPRPIKRAAGMEAYSSAESEIMRAVCERFSLPEEMPPSVHRADENLLATEAVYLMHPSCSASSFTPTGECRPDLTLGSAWSPRYARETFLNRFDQLWPTHLATVGEVASG